MSNSLRPHESQHARPPCPSPTPRVHSDSRPSSKWCHPAISSSVIPFSSCPQSLPASGYFPMSQLFTWGSQSTGVSAVTSFLPKKSQADPEYRCSNEWVILWGWVKQIGYTNDFLSRENEECLTWKHNFSQIYCQGQPRELNQSQETFLLSQSI